MEITYLITKVKFKHHTYEVLAVEYVTQVSKAPDRDVIYIHYINNPHNFSAGKVSSNYFSDFSDSETKAKRKKSLQVSLNRSQVFIFNFGNIFCF